MQLLDICQVLVNFSISFLFGKQFWASLHLLSESGWNWCPWQALVSFRFPIPCIVYSCLCLSCVKLGDFFQSRVALSWTEGSFSHFTLGNWAEHCFLKFQSCIWSSCHELLKSYLGFHRLMIRFRIKGHANMCQLEVVKPLVDTYWHEKYLIKSDRGLICVSKTAK